MAQARRSNEDGSGNAQTMPEESTILKNLQLDNTSDPSKLLGGHATHDQLCNAMHEEILNSEMTWSEISSLSIKEDMERSHSSNPGSERG